MDAQKVDMFIMTNGKYFAEEKDTAFLNITHNFCILFDALKEKTAHQR